MNVTVAAADQRMAQFYQERGYLSKKQIEIARKKIKKYTRQLLECIGESK